MKCFHSKLRLWAGLCLAVIAAASYLLSGGLVIGADTKSTKVTTTATGGDSNSTNTTTTAVGKTAATKKPATKLTGAELYSVNCNRCHAERYPTEFNSAQWKTLMLHMRVRANLPAKQAKEILKYLQEESGN